MWVFYYNFAINSSRCVKLCLNAYFVMVFRRIKQVYAGICHVQILETSIVTVDSYTLGSEKCRH
jgi:hypothetical protein